MTTSTSNLRCGLSLSSASWRWSRARCLARNPRYYDSRFADDELTLRAAQYQLHAARGALALVIARSSILATVAGAVQIAEGPEFARLAVEARLIALEDVDAIARKMGRPAAVIRAYELLFLDFRERHDVRCWMDDRIIRTRNRWKEANTLRAAVLLLAYDGGPVVADLVLNAAKSIGSDATWDSISRGAIAAEGASAIDRLTLMLLASVMAPRTVEAQRTLLKSHRRLKRDLGMFESTAREVPKAKDVDAGALAEEYVCAQVDAAFESPQSRKRAAEVA